MALQLVHKKKAISKTKAKKRKSNKDRFLEVIDTQILIANGQKVKKGKGLAKSWICDGKDYGSDKVIIPKVAGRKFYPKAVIAIKTGNGVAELNELKKMIKGGKLIANVNALYKKSSTKK